MFRHRRPTTVIASLALIICLVLFDTPPVSSVLAETQARSLYTGSNLLWARSMGGKSGDFGYSIALDSNGNIYTTGYFYGTADFDPSMGTYYLTSAGGGDVFISKLDSTGNFLWARSIGGDVGDDFGEGIAVDSSGNVYTAGAFQGTVDFDPGPGVYSVTSGGAMDIFISKLDSSGGFVWAKSISGVGGAMGMSITLDPTGNIYTTGEFEGATDFDPGDGVYNLTSALNCDIFVSKLDNNGSFVWAKKMGGMLVDEGKDIVLDQSGYVYITGQYADTVDFDPGDGVYNLTSAGGSDVFVSKLDNNGDFVWTKSMGGMNFEEGNGIAVDTTNGNVYTTGYFDGLADFDPGVGALTLTSAGSDDVFISKLDSNGDLVWVKGLGGTGYDWGNSIAISRRNVYITGVFRDTADFDLGPGVFNLTSVGFSDIFAIQLDSNGEFIGAKSMGGEGGDWARDIMIDSSSNIYITGDYTAIADFDPGTGVYNLTSVGGHDIFITKLKKSNTFTDVAPDYWAWEYIERLYNAGITSGCGTNPLLYCPTTTVTRDQMAIFLLRGEHGSSYVPPAATGVFQDVPTDYWAADWIEQLALEGITAGCNVSPKQYCPTTAVTRDQMAIFLLRAKYGSNYVPPKATGVFQDVPTDYWAADWIEQLATEGITAGCSVSPKLYCPTTPVTRDQMAIFLVRNFNLP